MVEPALWVAGLVVWAVLGEERLVVAVDRRVGVLSRDIVDTKSHHFAGVESHGFVHGYRPGSPSTAGRSVWSWANCF